MNTDTQAGTRRRLPIGMQTFREIRERDCYYVDKTAFIGRLLDEGKHYFLSRPRRFGKSLFLDTCKELFEGDEALFEGLAIHGLWDWSVRHPVLRLSFGSGNFKEPDHLPASVMAPLDAVERETGVVSGYASASNRFGHMLEALHRQAGRPVAVLVDEYDKPILDVLEEPEVARANRDFLRGLYATIKDCDAHVRFSFITGVSKFSKVSLFSGLNNVKDITLDPRYSAICGYTDADLDTVFAPELPGLDRDEIRDWYNGYSWRGEQRVYNPFDILLLFDTREFAAHWFETGTPTFLIDTLVERGVSALALDGMVGSAGLLSTFDVDAIAPEALLFQTGHLTVRVVHQQRHRPLRGLLRQRLLHLLRVGSGYRYQRGGQRHARPRGHGGPRRRQGVPVRVQGRGAGRARSGAGAVESEGLRGQVPRPGRACPPGRGGVQQRLAQRGGVRPRSRLTRHGDQDVRVAYKLPVVQPTWGNGEGVNVSWRDLGDGRRIAVGARRSVPGCPRSVSPGGLRFRQSAP